ncbi:hypothetical protein SAMN05216593_10433 [Pseudomonas asturiensis]|uniref:Uncharacterized protein n=1 Tax=Pseudomonas asturiensis TaxID=1190415 RepID=A0A1M7M996_9PSED|nr:hypothetical protein SAMN05216593_10433 [Pseudomonas asturiensis]
MKRRYSRTAKRVGAIRKGKHIRVCEVSTVANDVTLGTLLVGADAFTKAVDAHR